MGDLSSPPARRTRGCFCAPALALMMLASVVGAAAAETAEQMYTAALEREMEVRGVLMRADASATLLGDIRAIVAAYQEVVRVYPRSGYSDNALWQAGTLSVDAYLRFGQPRDGATGVRLLRLLASEYPTSSLVRNVENQVARVDDPTRQAATPARVATIRRIQRERLVDAVRITIELDREVNFYDERLPNPARVFLDLPFTRPAAALLDRTLRFDGDRDIVRQIRIGRHPNNTTRVVLEADGVGSYSVYPLYNPFRLVIDCVKEAPLLVQSEGQPGRTSASAVQSGGPEGPPLQSPESRSAAAAAGDAPEGARSVGQAGVPEGPTPRQSPAPASVGSGVLAVPDVAQAGVAEASPLPAPTDPPSSPPAPAAPPAKNANGRYSVARQLGLTVSRIVIDPGHGGHDPGATGPSITEAELVLDVAIRMEQLLQKTPGVEVILTRRTDEFVPLQERTTIANREGADLFLSIHANASPSASTTGIETYFLNFATNMSAASVAARENAASGHAMGALPDILKAIALNTKLDESRDLATAVQTALVQNLRKSNRSVKDLGVKQAPFVVLIGASMPSVLAEVSFVTNTQEAKLLRTEAYRQKIAEALVAAISKYQSSLKNVRRVAQQ